MKKTEKQLKTKKTKKFDAPGLRQIEKVGQVNDITPLYKSLSEKKRIDCLKGIKGWA